MEGPIDRIYKEKAGEMKRWSNRDREKQTEEMRRDIWTGNEEKARKRGRQREESWEIRRELERDRQRERGVE